MAWHKDGKTNALATDQQGSVKKLDVEWYRCPIERTKLRELTKRSDIMGFLFVLPQLAYFAGTAYLAHHFLVQEMWLWMAVAIYAHGVYRSIGHSGFHELSHGTVFRTRWLNSLFLRLWSILARANHHFYKMSHTYHHLNTLHPDGDGEVVLPRTFSLKFLRLIQLATFDFEMFVGGMLNGIRKAVGGRSSKVWDEWTKRLFAQNDDAAFRRVVRWERIVLLIHLAGVAVSAVTGFWMITILLTVAPNVGNWWGFLIGGTMHAGLRDNVPDFRLCVRSVKLDPVSGYFRWNMHYHIEHHMFAAIPCYKLGKLYGEVASDMPQRRTIVEAWREILGSQRRQESDPSYQFDTPLPHPSANAPSQDPLGADIGDIRPKGHVERT